MQYNTVYYRPKMHSAAFIHIQLSCTVLLVYAGLQMIVARFM